MLARLAERQQGLVSHAQLIDAGLTRGQIRHRLAAGRLHLLHRGVYAVGHPPTTGRAHLLAAVACGPGAVLSHVSAAVEHTLLRHRPAVIHVARPLPRRRAPKGVILHHVTDLQPGDVGDLDGIPITSPLRTLLDLATVAPPRDVQRAVNEARVLRLVTDTDLETRAAGRRGASLIRAALGSEPRLLRSTGEQLLLRLVERADLPRPQTNVFVGRWEVDGLWTDRRLALEVDGYATHGHRAAFAQDRIRDADLAGRGLRVIRVTWRQLVDRPEAVATRLAAALAHQ